MLDDMSKPMETVRCIIKDSSDVYILQDDGGSIALVQRESPPSTEYLSQNGEDVVTVDYYNGQFCVGRGEGVSWQWDTTGDETFHVDPREAAEAAITGFSTGNGQ